MRKRLLNKVIIGSYFLLVLSSPFAKVNPPIEPSTPVPILVSTHQSVMVVELDDAISSFQHVAFDGKEFSNALTRFAHHQTWHRKDKTTAALLDGLRDLRIAIHDAKEAARKALLKERRERREKRQEQRDAPVIGTGVLQTCPVHGTNNFTDTFGDARYAGGYHTHQGIDLMAAYGTPVVAVYDGVASDSYNSLGGNSVIVQHTNGDFTYYAHLSSYAATGQVSAGTIIGYVGSTGDTGVNHLHFEYHPGGGSAIDAYSLLLGVC